MYSKPHIILDKALDSLNSKDNTLPWKPLQLLKDSNIKNFDKYLIYDKIHRDGYCSVQYSKSNTGGKITEYTNNPAYYINFNGKAFIKSGGYGNILKIKNRKPLKDCGIFIAGAVALAIISMASGIVKSKLIEEPPKIILELQTDSLRQVYTTKP